MSVCLKPKTFRCSDNEYFIRTGSHAQRWRPLTGVKTAETETSDGTQRGMTDVSAVSVDIFSCSSVNEMNWIPVPHWVQMLNKPPQASSHFQEHAQ